MNIENDDAYGADESPLPTNKNKTNMTADHAISQDSKS